MKKLFKIILGVIAFFVVFFLINLFVNDYSEKELNKIENKVASDFEKQYEIAKRSGNKMDAYIQAGLTAAAYLQANDEESYNKWKKIEAEEAKNNGM